MGDDAADLVGGIWKTRAVVEVGEGEMDFFVLALRANANGVCDAIGVVEDESQGGDLGRGRGDFESGGRTGGWVEFCYDGMVGGSEEIVRV